MTSGISAEYGRFSGGVVNVVTKSGGNRFSGSFRSNLYKPDWTARTPFEKENENERTGRLSDNATYEIGCGFSTPIEKRVESQTIRSRRAAFPTSEGARTIEIT